MKKQTITTLALMGMFTSISQSGEPDIVPTPTAPPNQWEFSLTPYALLAGIDGSAEVGPLSVDFNSSFSDILSNLDAGLILAGEARYNRFSLQGDFIYLGISSDASRQKPIYDKAQIELDSIIFTGLAAYRIWEGPRGFIELGGGVRWFHAETDIKLKDTSGTFPSLTSSSTVDILDGVIAARYAHNLSSRWSLRLYGDIGTGDSDLTWQAWLNLGYTCTENVTLIAGYRHLHYDVGEGSTNIDLSFSGPQIGMTIRF